MVNYYQAVDTFLKINWIILKNYRFIFMLYQKTKRLFKKIAKNPYYDCSISVAASPAQATIQISQPLVKKIAAELTERKETASYNKLLDRKFLDQFTDISPAAADGKISHLLCNVSLLLKNNEMSSESAVYRFKHRCLASRSNSRSVLFRPKSCTKMKSL